MLYTKFHYIYQKEGNFGAPLRLVLLLLPLFIRPSEGQLLVEDVVTDETTAQGSRMQSLMPLLLPPVKDLSHLTGEKKCLSRAHTKKPAQVVLYLRERARERNKCINTG